MSNNLKKVKKPVEITEPSMVFIIEAYGEEEHNPDIVWKTPIMRICPACMISAITTALVCEMKNAEEEYENPGEFLKFVLADIQEKYDDPECCAEDIPNEPNAEKKFLN